MEDTEITHQEIKDLFKELGYETGFNNFIDEPLRLLTHDKSEPYDVYINKVMEHPTSALIKMCDMTDNLNMFGLIEMDDKVLERCVKYISYIKQINDKYHFLKKLDIARRYFKEEILDKANEQDPSDN